jgi:Cache 3/Cache 2 fusion domain
MKPPAQSGDESMKSILLRSVKKAHVIGMFVLAFGLLATPVLIPSVGNAQDARVAKSMAALKDQTTKLGAPKIDGKDVVGGRDAPALYFGSTKMNNNFSVVDAVAEEGGRGTAATLFVKSGDDYIRVATNVSTRIGSGRGLGTILTGAPLDSIKAGNAYYGKTSILGTPYVSGYEPIKDASGATIGVYFVGYTK